MHLCKIKLLCQLWLNMPGQLRRIKTTVPTITEHVRAAGHNKNSCAYYHWTCQQLCKIEVLCIPSLTTPVQLCRMIITVEVSTITEHASAAKQDINCYAYITEHAHCRCSGSSLNIPVQICSIKAIVHIITDHAKAAVQDDNNSWSFYHHWTCQCSFSG